MDDPIVQRVIASKYLVARDANTRFPLAGATQAFLVLSGTHSTLSEPAALELTIESDGGRSNNLWLPLNDWETDALANPSRTLLDTLNLPDAIAIGTLNVNVMSAVVKRSHTWPGRSLYRPGLHIVRARFLLAGSRAERLGRSPVASIRLYDSGPDDYSAQTGLASLQSVSALAAGGSAEAARMTDVPGVSLLSTGPLNESTVVRASYLYRAWKPGQLVLVGHALLQPTGDFSASVTYRYAGRRFVKASVPIVAAPEREPYGLLPLELDDAGSASTSEFSNWARFTIDLRALLPDLVRSW